jgi:hypothetical protein
MKVRRSFFTLAFVSLLFISLFVLGIPIAGLAGSPHSCPSNAHLPGSIGGQSSYDFNFAKNCSPDTSAAVQWKFFIYNYDDGTLICSGGPYSIGTTPLSFPCGPLPSPATIQVVINYKTTANGSWMTHTDLTSN